MKLKDQVCTLEQAKKLHEFGINKPATFKPTAFKWLRGEIELEEQEGENAGEILGVKRGFALFFAPDETVNPDNIIKVSSFTNPDVEFHWNEGGFDRIELTSPEYPAYTVAELGEMLPQSLKDPKENSVTHYLSQSNLDGWEVCYCRVDKLFAGCLHKVEEFPTEAQARAAMLIHLLENGIIEPAKTTEL